MVMGKLIQLIENLTCGIKGLNDVVFSFIGESGGTCDTKTEGITMCMLIIVFTISGVTVYSSTPAVWYTKAAELAT